jgi:hypothetical protein
MELYAAIREADVRLSPTKMGTRASCSAAARVTDVARSRAVLAPSFGPSVKSRADPVTPTAVDATLRVTENCRK